MRLVFAGTPVFAAHALEALIQSHHKLELVLTQPDRPAGRGKKLRQSAVKDVALRHQLPIAQPPTLKDPMTWEPIRQARPDAMIVAAYGLILPPDLLTIPARGCLNIHASLLPRWRGAAPIQRAIQAGDKTSGVCIMQMEAGLDTGPVWLRKICPIGPDDTGGQLHDTLAQSGAEALLEALNGLEAASLQARVQPEAGVTYAQKILPAERALDFNRSAQQLHDQIRAFDPTPGTTASLSDGPAQPIKIWRSEHVSRAALEQLSLSGPPGCVLQGEAGDVIIACGDGAGLRLLEVQRPGGRRMAIAAYQQAQDPISPGHNFHIVVDNT